MYCQKDFPNLTPIYQLYCILYLRNIILNYRDNLMEEIYIRWSLEFVIAFCKIYICVGVRFG
jgi:hypothetical protein